MKFNTFSSVILVLTVLSIGVILLLIYAYSGVQRIAIDTAKQSIRDGSIEYVVDIRTQLEYNSGHYPHSLHIPVSSLSKEKIELYIPYKTASILVYCNTGQRARYAANLISEYGYTNVVYIAESYTLLL